MAGDLGVGGYRAEGFEIEDFQEEAYSEIRPEACRMLCTHRRKWGKRQASNGHENPNAQSADCGATGMNNGAPNSDTGRGCGLTSSMYSVRGGAGQCGRCKSSKNANNNKRWRGFSTNELPIRCKHMRGR